MTLRDYPQDGEGVFFPTKKFVAVFDAYCSAPVFIFGWIQNRTKKITAMKTRADVGFRSAKINQTRSHSKSTRSPAFPALRSLKQD